MSISKTLLKFLREKETTKIEKCKEEKKTQTQKESIRNIQKTFYNFKYKVFCSKLQNFKFEILKSETLYLKFHRSNIFICILVPTITHLIYDS